MTMQIAGPDPREAPLARVEELELPMSGGEALGVAWCDLYKVVPRKNHKGMPANRIIKMSLTQRSYKGSLDAATLLNEAIQTLRHTGWLPYPP